MPISLNEFVRKWKISSLSELQSAQSHFNELCDLLGQPTPTDADPTGEFFCFNKALTKNYGGKGFADVWKRGYFAWEYKGKHKDLKAAYRQINDYREDLLNPPLLVVCDTNLFQIHTNLPNTAKRVYQFNLDDLGKNQVTATCPLPPLDVLRALFTNWDVLRPDRTDAYVTQETAKLFATLAQRLEIEQKLSATPQQIANFLIRILFCIFADAIGLLPDHLFRRLLDIDRFYPRRFLLKLPQLFAAMSAPDGMFGIDNIRYFNGGLFNPAQTDDLAVVQLDKQDMAVLHNVAANYNWAHVAPAIFGTLFERSLNKERRSLIGAHYTGEADILLLIEPVVMRPLRQRWEDTKAAVLQTLTPPPSTSDGLLHSNPQAERLLSAFFDHLSTVRILDPACGSGNFLYVALRRLLDLWLEVVDFVNAHDIQLMAQYALTHLPSPRQLLGIEVDDYAHRLASIVVWIGFLQWKHEHAVNEDQEPVLDPLATIEHNDAILRYDAEGKSYEPTWPKADFIVGNPPFVGGNRVRQKVGGRYIDDLFKLYTNRVEPFADYVCYWFEKARACVANSEETRAGLIATQAIRGGVNRGVLSRIKESGDIFYAVSDRKWSLDGAMVRISIVGFDNRLETEKILDKQVVPAIFANLTYGEDTTLATILRENTGICFMGVSPKGDFDINAEDAAKMLRAPLNVNRRPNSDVVKRVISGIDIVGTPRNLWTIDYGTDMTQMQAARYELPFEHLKRHVFPVRALNNRQSYREKWWLFAETRPAMRAALSGKTRYIATPATSKHRIFVWVQPDVLCNQGTLVFARDDDYFFGVLQSKLHEVWALEMGTQLESRPRYTPDTTFATFSFPWVPGQEPDLTHPKLRAISEAAAELVELRNNYLRPEPTPKTWLRSPDEDTGEPEPEKRTLTRLYNEIALSKRTWLADAHRLLDQAVFAAYGWPADLTTPEILSRLLALNHERAARAAAQPAQTPRPRKPRRSITTPANSSAPDPDDPAEGQRPGDIRD